MNQHSCGTGNIGRQYMADLEYVVGNVKGEPCGTILGYLCSRVLLRFEDF